MPDFWWKTWWKTADLGGKLPIFGGKLQPKNQAEKRFFEVLVDSFVVQRRFLNLDFLSFSHTKALTSYFGLLVIGG
ncbi:MAG TPA: hypothetical protein VKV18_15475 [Chthonomonas sp.]|uniref:hypothetical protein n=1 Tax=Chthonomonas sp. TaxID=2282153 RepID=UPI002B4B2503|nr:hypothetical protein [Chthonomonas sp.]HLI50070.1 hypothetical protein [Chthonomonas sp.]